MPPLSAVASAEQSQQATVLVSDCHTLGTAGKTRSHFRVALWPFHALFAAAGTASPTLTCMHRQQILFGSLAKRRILGALRPLLQSNRSAVFVGNLVSASQSLSGTKGKPSARLTALRRGQHSTLRSSSWPVYFAHMLSTSTSSCMMAHHFKHGKGQ